MLQYWLQQVTTVLKDSTATTLLKTGESPNTILGTLMKGGWIMVPLGILFVLMLYFFFERLIALRAATKLDDNFMNIVKDHIVNGNITAARSITKNTNNPIARIIDKGIQRISKKIESIDLSS